MNWRRLMSSMGSPPEPVVPAYRRLRMPRKRPAGPWATLNRSGRVGSRRDLTGVTHLFAQWLYRGDDAYGGERAADPLHCPGINAEPFICHRDGRSTDGGSAPLNLIFHVSVNWLTRFF